MAKGWVTLVFLPVIAPPDWWDVRGCAAGRPSGGRQRSSNGYQSDLLRSDDRSPDMSCGEVGYRYPGGRFGAGLADTRECTRCASGAS